MPSAQWYGVLFGCLTFFCTVTAVVTLLFLGGSFERIKQQAETGTPTVPSVVEARASRPLLLESLLEARARLLKKYATMDGSSSKFSILTRMLMNEAPNNVASVNDLVHEKSSKRTAAKNQVSSEFEQNYAIAYRMCQDKPGGEFKKDKCLLPYSIPLILTILLQTKLSPHIGNTLSGLPEARFEAYARAYAGCGNDTTTDYRRSYARLYEKMACATHGMEKKYSQHYEARPQDIVGRTVRLEPLEAERHAQEFWDITCGDAVLNHKSFDSNQVWAFWDFGPFATPQEMKESCIFCRSLPNEAAFCIVEMVTDRMVGVVFLTKDDPQNLSIQLEPPICKPSSEGTAEELEACFLLMDRLFASGYRRIQLALDTHDRKKLPGRLGFTQEGMIPKHMIVKESNRDSNIYGMLNSDWNKGARAFLFKKLHGAKAQRYDESNNKKEGEVEEQNSVLKERKRKEEAEEKENKKPWVWQEEF